MRPLLVSAVALATVAVGVSCVQDAPFPGESMGVFHFDAALVPPLSPNCERISELRDAGFSFEGTFSQLKDGSKAYFTINRISREATFDGQTMTSVYTAPRRFEVQGCPPDWQDTETLQVALLSESQSRAVSGSCEGFFADAGAIAVDADAGVVAPSFTSEGFDAVRACGALIEHLVPSTPSGAPQPCTAGGADGGEDGGTPSPDEVQGECTLFYRVDGVRKQ